MYSPRHARPSCLPVRAAAVGGLTALLLPLTMAAPALATTTSPTPSAPTSAAPAAPTVMRISASETGADNASRIGVRLLSADQPVVGKAVAIEMLADDGVWRYHGQATTDGQGLAVVRLPFARDTRVRSTFSGSATVAPKTSPEAVVKFNPASTLGQQAVQIAAQQVGKPYQWGSTGPNSFDCSGYVTYIYKTRLGKNVPRTSAQQEAGIPRVAQSAKRPGDLLFFRTGGRVSHVGVYAGGNAMYASPSAGDRVKLQSIYTSSYTVGRVS